MVTRRLGAGWPSLNPEPALHEKGLPQLSRFSKAGTLPWTAGFSSDPLNPDVPPLAFHQPAPARTWTRLNFCFQKFC